MANWKQPIPQISQFEGGVSNAKTDWASRFPVPDGSGNHTNKGITWATFIALAPYLKYPATPAHFYAMPKDTWEAIFKNGYWNVIGGDGIKSQAIADTLVDFAWGAGPGTAAMEMQKLLKVKPDGVVGEKTIKAINSRNEKQLFTDLTAWKKHYYLTLPNQQANYKGWEDRLNKEWTLNQKLLVAGVSTLSIVAISAISFFLLTNISDDKTKNK